MDGFIKDAMLRAKKLAASKAKWTLRDLDSLPSELQYEILDSGLYFAPEPDPIDQKVSGNVLALLSEYINRNGLGVVFDSSTYLVLDNKDVVKPDAVFFAADTPMRFHNKSAYGIPDIIIECIPEGYGNFHRYTKKDVYEAAKVKEFWLIDLATETILVKTLERFGYVDYSSCDRQGVAKSALLPSFSLIGLQVFR